MAIHIKPSHKGRLHRALGVPEGQPIPAAKVAAAKRSSSAAVRKEATFAQNAKGWHHGGSKSHHLRKASEHVTAAHRQHTMEGAREHLGAAMAHMKKAGVAHGGESHGYSFRDKR
jgi:hypothetical protein